ncbi:cobalt-precorrin-5B (C(1))-methyltransferase CbiD [Parabacteroides sp. FAFU027]|uniref:cobalt-precorrin-5B (C(1))-methyltransferase CbiD n=1 Tax=Parabacteroides sp. FAFU027 TaxID=2922715 RepID=UPI001FAF7A67|nr:cobalt-precorrin-5B (C(1))-methyltransferase CbiD [Parabacteroides sp. FAFU027]
MLATKYINGKTYRCGYTTGSCAAAAAKAATALLLCAEWEEQVIIQTPAGIELTLDVLEQQSTPDFAYCCVVKDAGDDPDVTHGIRVYARASRNTENRIIVKGGIGVGVVTKRGLQVSVGEAAINPGPMKMILAEVSEVCGEDCGITIEISVPEGVEIAKKTFNEKLGIVGGISILGTSGIVSPMSDEAFKEALALELSMQKEAGHDSVIFSPGNYGENFIAEFAEVDPERIVKTSNFIGYMLHQAVFYQMKRVVLVGHIGKLIKVAGGIFNTHSSVADGRREVMAAHYFHNTNDAAGFAHIMQSNTTEEAIEAVRDDSFFHYLCGEIQTRCVDHVKGKLEVEVILFALDRGLLGVTDGAEITLKNHFNSKL